MFWKNKKADKPRGTQILLGMVMLMEYDVTFKDGQTIGGSEEEKIAISFSKGKLVEGDTFKLAY